MSASSLSSYPTGPGTNDSTSQRVQSTFLPAASGSLDTLAVPDATPISVSGASGSEEHVGFPVQTFCAESDLEDAQMISDTDGNGISVAGGVKIAPELIPAASGHRRHASPVEADDGGLTSGLPTPPSEIFSGHPEPRVASRLIREHGATTNSTLISRTYLPRNLPVIPTPPFLTPERSFGEDREVLDGRDRGSAQQGSLRAFSESLSPLTPPLLSPCPAVGSLLSEEGGGDGNGRIAVQKVTEELTNSTDGARATVVCGGGITVNAPTNDGRSSSGPQTDPAHVEGFSATNLGVPVITVTHERWSTTMSNKDLSQVSQGSSVGQPNIDSPEHHPDANDIGPAYSPMNGYDFSFSSPLRHPLHPTSTTPSRYATPSDSTGSRPAQEEDEVSSALMLGASGMSTPIADSPSLPLMFSQHPSRGSSVRPQSSQKLSKPTSTYADDAVVQHASSTLAPELFAVDPSMLHGPTPTHFPHQPESQSLPPVSAGPLSSLTSLDDTNGDGRGDDDADLDPDTARHRKKHRASAPVVRAGRPRGRSSRGRRSEPHATPLSRAMASVVRGASEATVVELDGRAVGGPNASLHELASLARREPLRICLKIPGSMRGVKRKWGIVDGDGEGGGAGRESGCADSRGEGVCPEASGIIPVDDASQEGQGKRVSTGVCQLCSVLWSSTDS